MLVIQRDKKKKKQPVGRELAETASDHSHNYACIIPKLPFSTTLMMKKAVIKIDKGYMKSSQSKSQCFSDNKVYLINHPHYYSNGQTSLNVFCDMLLLKVIILTTIS